VDRERVDEKPRVRGARRDPRDAARQAHGGARPVQQAVVLRRAIPDAAVRVAGGDPGARQAAVGAAGATSDLRALRAPWSPEFT